jgi:hypothetical protein
MVRAHARTDRRARYGERTHAGAPATSSTRPPSFVSSNWIVGDVRNLANCRGAAEAQEARTARRRLRSGYTFSTNPTARPSAVRCVVVVLCRLCAEMGRRAR